MQLKETKLAAYSEETFWLKFIDIIQIIKNTKITKRERKLLVAAIQRDEENPFIGDARRELKEQLDMTESNFAVTFQSLKNKGWLNKDSLPEFIQTIKRLNDGEIKFVLSIQRVDLQRDGKEVAIQ